MPSRLAIIVALLALLTHSSRAATSGQSFLYVASPQLPCAGSSDPCPASEILVYDADTLGLVTRIPLPAGSSQHRLAFGLHGLLYAVGDKGVTAIDPTTHTGRLLPEVSPGGGVPKAAAAMTRDGSWMYLAHRSTGPDFISRTNLATGGAQSFIAGPLRYGADGLAISPVADRMYVNGVTEATGRGLIEYDIAADQELRRLPGVTDGPIAVSPDGTRIFSGASGFTPFTNGIVALDASTLSQVALFELPWIPVLRLLAGPGGTRLYSIHVKTSPTSTHVRVFDTATLQPAPLVDAVVDGATNLVAGPGESRLFVGATSETSRTFAGGGVNLTYANRVAVIDAQTGQALGDISLPPSSYRIASGSPTPTPDSIAALAVTPSGAPRCSYRLGPRQNIWTTAGGSTSIALTTPCTWVASSDAPWVRLSQTAGTSGATLTVTVDPAVGATARAATVTIAGQLVTISQAGVGSTPPFGVFDTPVESSAGHSGSLAATGWALDDAGVVGVRIFRDPVAGEPPNAPVFIGTATLVDGARPDVAAAFPTHPLNARAGWGLNILTNVLPNQGNGTFRLYAHIDDVEGHTTVLGPRSFMSSNVNIVVPFGAIDTPAQGETVSGTIVNFGWALTPQPNTIPLDGSTIDVVIDGVVVGHPTYNNFRSDIAALFPGYQNSNGAVGHFTIDTTQYANGLHTIAWVVRDNAGNAAGIGSRYFTIQN